MTNLASTQKEYTPSWITCLILLFVIFVVVSKQTEKLQTFSYDLNEMVFLSQLK
jgi:hypothetical protein